MVILIKLCKDLKYLSLNVLKKILIYAGSGSLYKYQKP